MLKKFLSEVVVLVVGKSAEPIAELLESKKHVNEFILAKKLDITINQTRNILYKLADNGLVSSVRKKDKKKGWYTYFWKMELLKSLEFLKGILDKRIEQINYSIKSRETKQFYACERCNIEFTEENALLHDFTCNECGGVFTLRDNSKFLKELKKTINRISSERAFVEVEIEKENERLGKIKEKENKKIEAEKVKKRLDAKKKRLKDKKSLERKSKKELKKKSSTKKGSGKKVSRGKAKKTSSKKVVKKSDRPRVVGRKKVVKKVSKKSSKKKK